MARSDVDLFCVFLGQKHYRIFTTNNTEDTDESQRSQKGCSLPERIAFRITVHALGTNWTSTLTLSS